MKSKSWLSALVLFGSLSLTLSAREPIQNLQQYNEALPVWGVSWAPGKDAVNGYYPSFYTGFAMRSAFPERIHVRLARGNQTRVSVILDQDTVRDYVFDLATRYDFYQSILASRLITPAQSVSGAAALPQLEYFSEVVQSKDYGLLEFVKNARAGRYTDAEIYQKSLATLSTLNPGRVYNIQLDLTREFLKWQRQIQVNGAPATEIDQLLAINSIVWGRINYIEQPSPEILQALDQAVNLAFSNKQDEFIQAALRLLQLATGTRYEIQMVNGNGQWRDAIQCPSSSQCQLNYPEFTAIYPTGTAMASTRDQQGNKINDFATPGLWQFLSRGNRHDVDNIREEPYYGWAPKMDYEAAGNGFHNPAVRFAGVSKTVKTAMSLPESHTTFWSVKRGGVSHGCARLPLGHVWEMRHIFPVENSQMTKIPFFGNHPQDFDVFDIDGDGSPEVMGVEYFISYDLKGNGGVDRREGANLEINPNSRQDFYRNLYGVNGVYTLNKKGLPVFSDPTVSVLTYRDFQKKKIAGRLMLPGEYPLFEQAYEQDKVQFFVTPNMQSLTQGGKSPQAKRIVRLLGRVRGCAPTADQTACGAKAFNNEAKELVPTFDHSADKH